MGAILELAAIALRRAGDSAEIAAQNMSNMGTSAYKRRIDFGTLLTGDRVAVPGAAQQSGVVDFSAGHQTVSDNIYDIAINGDGFFTVRDAAGIVYTRDGRFHRDENGHLINAAAQMLQANGGGDLILSTANPRVETDGTVVEDGQATARITLVDFDDRSVLRPAVAGGFAAPAEAAHAITDPSMRQGAFETSNVSSGNEMLLLMSALRRAETGQRLVQVYDELMGRALSSFGAAG